MNTTNQEDIKSKVHDFWNDETCGTQFATNALYTKEYYEDIEQHRFATIPSIFSFAQFTRHYGQKILEVGVGAGTDMLQWVRAGTQAYGIDLTEAGIDHVQKRLALYGLQAEELRVADCENLPYADNTFDLVYSYGVIHHTPNTEKAMEEIVRVCRKGGMGKVMIYHRHSLLAYFFWVKHALLAGKPWKSLQWVLYHHMESIGTKAYTKQEALSMLKHLPVKDITIETELTYYDRLERFNPLFRAIAKVAAAVMGGNRVGWFMNITFTKK